MFLKANLYISIHFSFIKQLFITHQKQLRDLKEIKKMKQIIMEPIS